MQIHVDVSWTRLRTDEVISLQLLSIKHYRNESDISFFSQLYKKKYKQRKENLHRRRFYPPHVPPIFPRSPFPSAPAPLPLPLYPPGIIGGDYDQSPVILPRPRFDPIGPLPGHLPGADVPIGRRSLRPGGTRPADIRRGFIWAYFSKHVEMILMVFFVVIKAFLGRFWNRFIEGIIHPKMNYSFIRTLKKRDVFELQKMFNKKSWPLRCVCGVTCGRPHHCCSTQACVSPGTPWCPPARPAAPGSPPWQRRRTRTPRPGPRPSACETRPSQEPPRADWTRTRVWRWPASRPLTAARSPPYWPARAAARPERRWAGPSTTSPWQPRDGVETALKETIKKNKFYFYIINIFITLVTRGLINNSSLIYRCIYYFRPGYIWRNTISQHTVV